MSDVWGSVFQMERDKATGNDADSLRRRISELERENHEFRAALRYVYEQDRGYVIPHGYALDETRIIERKPGCNVLYLGHMGVKARDALGVDR